MATREVSVAEPFAMRRSLGAFGVGSFDDRDRWWWAPIVGGAASTLMVERTEAGVRGTAWGPGADQLLHRLPTIVGSGDVVSIVGRDERSRALLRTARGTRIGATGDVWGAAIKAVLGQVVTTKEAGESERKLRRRYGLAAPGPRPGLRTAAPPDVIAGLGYADLHAVGVERKRADILIEVARRSRRMAEVLEMDRDAAYDRLEAVRGIGPWSSAMIMGTAWGDTDAVPVGDYHVPNAIAWVLAGEERGTDDRMLELLEPYRPERRRIVLAAKQSGVHAPRYGPKTAVRTHL